VVYLIDIDIMYRPAGVGCLNRGTVGLLLDMMIGGVKSLKNCGTVEGVWLQKTEAKQASGAALKINTKR
jgi:hypothetical protein